MMEGLYSDIYKLRMLIKSELMYNLKPSDLHKGKNLFVLLSIKLCP